jgi:hypothetical protein
MKGVKPEKRQAIKVQRCEAGCSELFRSRVSAVGSRVQVFRYGYRFGI